MIGKAIKDITGLRSGKLVVLGLSDKKGRQWRWLCQCDCGRQTRTFGFQLRSGRSKSCGCVAAEKSRQRWENPTQAMTEARSQSSTTHGMTGHPAYQAWADMKGRCLKPSHKWFPSYGGRGIRICEKWSASFEAFWKDVGEGWFSGAQLGRIDNDGNYEPANVRWETREQQQNNRSCTVYVNTPDGVMSASQAAKRYGLTSSCILHRHRAGYSAQELTKPSQRIAKKDRNHD